jgi:hypothetical protein
VASAWIELDATIDPASEVRMDFDTKLKMAIYGHFAESTKAPSVFEMAGAIGAPEREVFEGYERLAAQRVLVLESDGETIRMAPPFSGIPTQHRVRVGDKEYFANCAWDALGISVALHADAEIYSRCEQSKQPLHIVVEGRPFPVPLVIHFAVPAAQWWDDIVYT